MVFKESVLDGLHLFFFLFLLLFLRLFFGLFSFSLRFRFFLGLLPFDRLRLHLFLDFATTIAPYHYIAYQYENFVILEWFIHGLNAELNICDLCLVEIVDINLTLVNCLFPEQFRFFSFQNLLNAIGFGIERRSDCAHVDRVFSRFLH